MLLAALVSNKKSNISDSVCRLWSVLFIFNTDLEKEVQACNLCVGIVRCTESDDFSLFLIFYFQVVIKSASSAASLGRQR